MLFERSCRDTPEETTKPITLAAYIDLWLREIAPGKLAKSTIRRDQQDIVRILPALGHYKLTELRPEHFRAFYVMRDERQRRKLLTRRLWERSSPLWRTRASSMRLISSW